jgi:transcriptional regulator with XRE-family HTH domain
MESNTLNGQHVGTKIKKVRELRNFTQEYVAEQVGMTTSGYSRIERGEVKVTIERLGQIAKALDLRPHDLTSFDENAFFSSSGNGNDQRFRKNGDQVHLQQVIATYEARIADLKDEIQFLRGVLRV